MATESQKLTQQEIDALLEMLPHEAEEAEAAPATQEATLSKKRSTEPQRYDFRSPTKLSKEQVWTLQMIHENLAKRLTAFLSVYLRSKVQVTLSTLEQGTYAVFVADMPNPTITFIVRLLPLPGRTILGMGPDLALAIIDRMLGGAGKLRTWSRELTNLENALLRKAVQKILAELAGAWSNVVQLDPKIEGVVMNPLFAGVAFPSDSSLLAVFDVFFEESPGTMTILIPFSVLDPIAQDLSAGMWGRRPESGAATKSVHLKHMAAHLARIKIPVSVRLTTLQLDLKDLIHLQPGDVLLMDTRKDQWAKVYLANRHKCWGRVGTVDGRMAVRIEEIIEPEYAVPEIPLPEAAETATASTPAEKAAPENAAPATPVSEPVTSPSAEEPPSADAHTTAEIPGGADEQRTDGQ